MGRDDRCISDHGKEVLFFKPRTWTSHNTFFLLALFVLQGRFPFLDEDVIETLLKFPLWDIADLDKPAGIGDKKILREVCP